LESIAAQTRQPDELVVGDDQSTDNTRDVIGDFSRRVSFAVRLETNSERLGSTLNFERIMERCTGDLIVLSDQDDVWRNDKLEKIEAAFRENPNASYAFSDGAQIDEAGRLIKGSLWEGAFFGEDERALYRTGRGAEVLLRHNVVTGAAMAVRRRAAGQALPFSRRWIHDYWLACILEASGRGVLIEEPLISYRRHAAQQVGLSGFSLMSMLKRIREVDHTYCTNEAQAFREAAHRITQIGSAKKLSNSMGEKAAFCEWRADLRRRPLSAPLRVLHKWWIGDYRRFTPLIGSLLTAVPLDILASLFSSVAGRSGKK
jgi:glycosyltransferase involved in cell wall biosynthesis